MKPSTPSLFPGARRPKTGRPLWIGLGIGLIFLAAVIGALVARDTLKAMPTAALAVNATLNLMPLLAASLGSYLAPTRKMVWGVVIGLASQLPFLLLGLLVLNWLLIVLWPVIFAVVGGTVVTVVIGAALGTWLSRVVGERRGRSLHPER